MLCINEGKLKRRATRDERCSLPGLPAVSRPKNSFGDFVNLVISSFHYPGQRGAQELASPDKNSRLRRNILPMAAAIGRAQHLSSSLPRTRVRDSPAIRRVDHLDRREYPGWVGGRRGRGGRRERRRQGLRDRWRGLRRRATRRGI